MKKLRELRQMLSQSDVKNSLILRKFIIVSMCEIFKDIVPSYKIRPWTEKENEQKVFIFNIFELIKKFFNSNFDIFSCDLNSGRQRGWRAQTLRRVSS